MNTIKKTRQEMVEALTRYDLQWLAAGNAAAKSEMDYCVEFFAKGGYNIWTDKELIDLYIENVAPEDATVELQEAA